MVYLNLSRLLTDRFFVSRQRAVNLSAYPATVTSSGNSRLTALCIGDSMPSGVYKHSRRVADVVINCVVCGKSVSMKPGEARQRTMMYCSKKCSSTKPETHVIVSCKQCGKEFSKYKVKVKENNFCSKRCNGAFLFRFDAVRRKRSGTVRIKKTVDDVKEYFRQYLIKNREKHNARSRLWNVNNREKKAISRIRRRSADKNGTLTAEQWQALKEFYNYTCLCCKRQEPEIKLTLDHVLPTSKGGLSTYENSQPLCTSCNQKKGTKTIDYRAVYGIDILEVLK